MPTEPANAPIRSDVKAIHDQAGALLSDSRQCLQQVDDLHMGQHVVAGGGVQGGRESQRAVANLALEISAATPSLSSSGPRGFKLFGS